MGWVLALGWVFDIVLGWVFGYTGELGSLYLSLDLYITKRSCTYPMADHGAPVYRIALA